MSLEVILLLSAHTRDAQKCTECTFVRRKVKVKPFDR